MNRLHVLVFIEHGTRRMHPGGVTASPAGEQTVQQARTLRRELPGRMLIFSEAHLRAVLTGYQVRCNTARPHQGIAQRVPGCEREVPGVPAVNFDVWRIRREPVLNGLINQYSRAA